MKEIYTQKAKEPMRIIVFASGGGGNLSAAINLSKENQNSLEVGLVVTDRLGIKAIDIAKEHGIEVIASDFEKECGNWKNCKDDPKRRAAYHENAISFHNRILEQIKGIEGSTKKPFDLVVLSYHRWIQGNLLRYFKGRMINQHAGDLTIMKKGNLKLRRYIGINPVLLALRSGETKTRTSTFLVRSGKDNGEILCQGPWVHYKGPKPVTRESAWKHEVIQKHESDWPALRFVLKGISMGRYGLSDRKKYPDGCSIVFYDERPVPYGGIELK